MGIYIDKIVFFNAFSLKNNEWVRKVLHAWAHETTRTVTIAHFPKRRQSYEIVIPYQTYKFRYLLLCLKTIPKVLLHSIMNFLGNEIV